MNPEDFHSSSAGKVVQSPQGNWTFIPEPLPPEIVWSSNLITALSEADRALGELAGLGRSLVNPHLLVRPFIRREAVLSSRIEGTQASMTDLYAYETTQLHLFEMASDVQEVQNYVNALEFGIDQLATFPVSLRLIRDLHAQLMEGVRGEQWSPGEFRRDQNFIGPPGSTIETATYIPPTVTDMHPALDEFEKYLHSQSDLPPLIRLALIHYQFEAIHPFADGNGRIGRLLISLLLCAWGLLPQPLLYLSEFFEAHRGEYYQSLLSVSQSGDWVGWLDYFLLGVKTQSLDSVQRIRYLQDLRQKYRTQFQTERAAARLLQVVDFLFEQPILTIQKVGLQLDVHYPAAKRYVDRLEDAGILSEITGRARDRVYRANEILRAIEMPLKAEVND